MFHADIINTRNIITFQGTAAAAIEKAFKNSVEDYLAWCKEEGLEPEKPYSGKFNLRPPPELHKEAAIKAKKLKIAINAL
ncbi:MAG: type II toxin-antitoxin system HicB family antitoxin [Treponema sp.]|nr:type II toxin-antitoxin system HicB family antitoxin [Treponema sp.]